MTHLALIGMSNIGKSSWARRLGKAGYRVVDCDRLIALRVIQRSVDATANDALAAMAGWLGFPGDADYEQHSRRYAEAEQAVMVEALDSLQDGQPTVIDTTGSVIYCGADILARVRSQTRVVYLDTSDAQTDALYRRYAERPKPVLWDTHYCPLPGEAAAAARQRCYPDLLRDRARRYAELAHATVPFSRHQDRRADPVTLFLA